MVDSDPLERLTTLRHLGVGALREQVRAEFNRVAAMRDYPPTQEEIDADVELTVRTLVRKERECRNV